MSASDFRDWLILFPSPYTSTSNPKFSNNAMASDKLSFVTLGIIDLSLIDAE